MELAEEQFLEIEPFLPTPRRNVTHDTCAVLNAILYVLENGCKWRSLPKIYGTGTTDEFAQKIPRGKRSSCYDRTKMVLMADDK
ncbi:MAG: transposase [Puniceicoccales bacterium]|jgi:transposase|nr:transposase [Puniceicoccales bacterium]